MDFLLSCEALCIILAQIFNLNVGQTLRLTLLLVLEVKDFLVCSFMFNVLMVFKNAL